MPKKGKKEEISEWMKKATLYRLSNTSNAMVFPTMDKTRWQQIEYLAVERYPKLYDDIKYDIYEWDIVENRIVKLTMDKNRRVKGEEYLLQIDRDRERGATITRLKKKEHYHEISQMSYTQLVDFTWRHFLREMRMNPMILIVKATALTNANREALTKILDNMVGVVGRDPMMFKQYSTLFVIVPSAEYLSQTAQKLAVVVDIPIGTEEERRKRLEVLTEKLKQMGMLKKGVKVSEDLVKVSAGLNLDEIETATLMSAYMYNDLNPEVYRTYKIEMLKKYGIEYIEPKYGFEKVGGYNDLKEYVRKGILEVIKHPEIARKYGKDIPRGLLLYGLPGTGKTWFAHALAKELDLPVIKISPADFMRGIVGETEQRIKQLTKIIDTLSPAVVFMDEIDQLAIRREGMAITDSGVRRSAINMLLEWLGDAERKAFVVGATNLLEDMDPAFIRPGRMDKIVFVPTPDLQGRKEILEIHMLKEKPIDTSQIKFNPDILWEVAKRTEYWTGAELKQLCENVKEIAMWNGDNEITIEHFNRAMDNMGLDVSHRKEELSKMLRILRERVNSGNVDMNYIKKVEKQLGISGIELDIEGSRISSKPKPMDIDFGWGI